MTNSFWWSNNNDGPAPQPPAVEPSYDVKESLRFDGEDNRMKRTPSESDGERVGETGTINNVTYNEDGTVTIQVSNGLEPHQDLQGDYLQVGDSLTQSAEGDVSSSTITAATTPYVIEESTIFNTDSLSSLTRTPDADGNSKTWTVAFWIKGWNTVGTSAVLSTYNEVTGGIGQQSYMTIVFTANGSIAIGTGSQAFFTSDPLLTDQSSWEHFVVTLDTTHPVESQRVKVYQNGVRILATGGTPPGLNNELGLGQAGNAHRIGIEVGQFVLDGYLCDVFYVDGYAHTPDAFGEYNSLGQWAAKTPDLSRLSPYDQRPNVSEDWSSYWSGTLYGGTYSFENVHSGDRTLVGEAAGQANAALPAQGQVLTFEPPTPITVNTSVTLLGADGGGAGQQKLFVINEGRADEVAFYNKAPGPGYQELIATADEIGGAIHNIKLYGYEAGGGNSAYLGAITVDGKYLQDGPADNSQNWSDGANNGFGPNPVHIAFNRPKLDLISQSNTLISNTNSTYVAPGKNGTIEGFNLPITRDVQVIASSETGGAGTIKLVATDGASYTFTSISTSIFELRTSAELVGKTLDKIVIDLSTASGNNGIYLTSVLVDGVTLIDSGAQWDTSKVWSRGVTSARPLAIGSKAEMFNGVTPSTSDDWTNWYVSGYQGQDQPVKYTFETPYPVTENSTFRAWCYNGGGSWSASINGTPTAMSDADANGGAPIKTLTRLRFKTVWGWMYVSQILINNSRLTTGTLNNSGSWSNPTAWKSANIAEETYSQNASGLYFDVTLDTPIENFYSLSIGLYLDSFVSGTPLEIELFFDDNTTYTRVYAVNGDAPAGDFNGRYLQDFTNLGTGGANGLGFWGTVILPAGTTSITSFELNGNGETNSGNGVAAIEIDGKILVDGQQGSSGFHLPLGSKQSSAYYNDFFAITTTGIGFVDNGDIIPTRESLYKLYNGQLIDGLQTNAYAGLNYIDFVPTTPITGNVKVCLRQGGGVLYRFRTELNGSDTTIGQSIAQGGVEWVDLGNITIDNTFGLRISGQISNGSGEIYIRGLMIDGQILLNHTSVGADAFGHNHFIDSGITNGPGGTSDEVWSGNTTGYSGPAPGAFDGDFTTTGDAISYAGKAKAVFTTPRRGSVVECYLATGTVFTGAAYGINDGDASEASRVIGNADVPGWLEVYNGAEIDITDVWSRRAPNSNGSQQAAWRIDGQILLDRPGGITKDSPTGFINADSESVGSFCLINPLDLGNNMSNDHGNLMVTKDGTSWSGSYSRGNISVSSGKWYWEVTRVSDAPYAIYGVATIDAINTDYSSANNNIWAYNSQTGGKLGDDFTGSGGVYGDSFWRGDVIGVALDMDAGTIEFFKNGVSQGIAFDTLVGKHLLPWIALYTDGDSAIANFGQKDWKYPAPAGHKALCHIHL